MFINSFGAVVAVQWEAVVDQRGMFPEIKVLVVPVGYLRSDTTLPALLQMKDSGIWKYGILFH